MCKGYFLYYASSNTNMPCFVRVKGSIRFSPSERNVKMNHSQDRSWLVSAKVNCFLHRLIYSSVSVMIIVHARSPRLLTHSMRLTCLHYYLKGNMTWFLGSRQPRQIREWKKKKRRSSDAWSRALANQTRAAESINITTSKIRAGVQLARRYRANTLNTAWLSLTNYVPAAANDRKQRLDCDLIFLRQLWLELWDKSKFHVMECGSLETELKRSLIVLIMKRRNVQQLLYVG